MKLLNPWIIAPIALVSTVLVVQAVVPQVDDYGKVIDQLKVNRYFEQHIAKVEYKPGLKTEYDEKTPDAILAKKKGWLTIEQAPPKKIGMYLIDRPPEYRQVEITPKGEQELQYNKELGYYFFVLGEPDLDRLEIEEVVKPTDDSNIARAKAVYQLKKTELGAEYELVHETQINWKRSININMVKRDGVWYLDRVTNILIP